MQETTFPVEIIIHDDASTDKTADIIREYADKYSNLFITILQKENQYSKGIKAIPNFVLPKAKGKYIALCEGDDYWTDPEKLQKQVCFLESDQRYSLVYHDSIDFDCVTTKCYDKSSIKRYINKNPVSIKKRPKTLTLMFPTKYIYELPIELYKAPNGDAALRAYLSSKGFFMYLKGIKPSIRRIQGNGLMGGRSEIDVIDRRIATQKVIYKSNIDDYCTIKAKKAYNKFRIRKYILIAQNEVNYISKLKFLISGIFLAFKSFEIRFYLSHFTRGKK